jgi:hypothetical protein
MDEFKWCSEANDILINDNSFVCELFGDTVAIQSYVTGNSATNLTEVEELMPSMGHPDNDTAELNELLAVINRIQMKCKLYKRLDANRLKLESQLEKVLMDIMSNNSIGGGSTPSSSGATVTPPPIDSQNLKTYLGIICFLSSIYNCMYATRGDSNASFSKDLLYRDEYSSGSNSSSGNSGSSGVGVQSSFQAVLLQHLKAYVRSCLALQQDRGFERDCVVESIAKATETENSPSIVAVDSTLEKILPLLAEVDELVSLMLLSNEHGSVLKQPPPAAKPMAYEPFTYTPVVDQSSSLLKEGTALTAEVFERCHSQLLSDNGLNVANTDGSPITSDEMEINQLFSELVLLLGGGGDDGDVDVDVPPELTHSLSNNNVSAAVLKNLQYSQLFRLLQLQLGNHMGTADMANISGSENDTPLQPPSPLSPLADELLGKQEQSVIILHKCLSLCLKYAPFQCTAGVQ